MTTPETTAPGKPVDPLEAIALQADGVTNADGQPTPEAAPPVDPETAKNIEMMKGLATGLLMGLLAKGRAYVAKDLPEFYLTCPDELLQPPAVELVKLGENYLAALTAMAGSSTKFAPLFMALFPIGMAYMGAQQMHAEAKKKDPDAAAAGG